jgi:hypothetical protein
MENKFVNRKLEKRGVVSPSHERLDSWELDIMIRSSGICELIDILPITIGWEFGDGWSFTNKGLKTSIYPLQWDNNSLIPLLNLVLHWVFWYIVYIMLNSLWGISDFTNK